MKIVRQIWHAFSNMCLRHSQHMTNYVFEMCNLITFHIYVTCEPITSIKRAKPICSILNFLGFLLPRVSCLLHHSQTTIYLHLIHLLLKFSLQIFLLCNISHNKRSHLSFRRRPTLSLIPPPPTSHQA